MSPRASARMIGVEGKSCRCGIVWTAIALIAGKNRWRKGEDGSDVLMFFLSKRLLAVARTA